MRRLIWLVSISGLIGIGLLFLIRPKKSKENEFRSQLSPELLNLIQKTEDIPEIYCDSIEFYANRTLKKAEVENSMYAIGFARRNLAFASLCKTDTSGAKKELNLALDAWHKIDYGRGESAIYADIAEIEINYRGKTEVALKYYDSCIQLNKLIEDSVNVSIAYLNKAAILRRIGKYASAFVTLDSSLIWLSYSSKTFNAAGYQYEKGKTLFHLALINPEKPILSFIDSAKILTERAIENYTLLNKELEINRCNLLLGQIEAAKGNHSSAHTILLSTLKDMNIGVNDVHCEATIEFANLLMKKGIYDSAERYLSELKIKVDSLKFLNVECSHCISTGHLAVLRKDYQEAMNCAHLAINGGKMSGDKLLYAQALVLAKDVALKQKNILSFDSLRTELQELVDNSLVEVLSDFGGNSLHQSTIPLKKYSIKWYENDESFLAFLFLCALALVFSCIYFVSKINNLVWRAIDIFLSKNFNDASEKKGASGLIRMVFRKFYFAIIFFLIYVLFHSAHMFIHHYTGHVLHLGIMLQWIIIAFIGFILSLVHEFVLRKIHENKNELKQKR